MRRRMVWFLLVAGLSAACSTDPEVEKREAMQRGDERVQAKNYPEAILAYKKAIQIDPRLAEAHAKLGDAYVAVKDLENAFREYIRVADLLPDDTQAQIRAGNVL